MSFFTSDEADVADELVLELAETADLVDPPLPTGLRSTALLLFLNVRNTIFSYEEIKTLKFLKLRYEKPSSSIKK